MAASRSKPSPALGGGAGVGRAAWVAQQKSRKAVLYVIRVYNEGESFYKLGITFNLSARFARLKTCYKWRTVARFSSWNAGLVFDLEQRLHAEFSAPSYAPTADFGGKTECYSEAAALLAALPASTFFLKNTETLI
jgi:hypothetical protein